MTKLEKNFAVDSCKVRILLSEVIILDTTILNPKFKIVGDYVTGEIENEKIIKSSSKEIKFNGYSIKVALTEFYDFKKKDKDEFLEIYLHSKILEHNYFDGITCKNISEIYNKLMTAKVFFVTEQTFLNSLVNDIDIKTDFIASKIIFKELCNELKKRTAETTTRGQGSSLWEKTNNLEFNKRDTSTLAKPFVKFYDKEVEAIEKNSIFFKDFPSDKLKDKKRLEVTCKKSSDIKKFFEIENSTLQNILNLSQEKLSKYVSYAVQQNLNNVMKVKKSNKENKSAIDILINIHFANSLDNQNLTFLETLTEFLSHIDDKQMKIRLKKLAINWNFEREGIKGLNQRKMIVEVEDKITSILEDFGIV